jgi:hypothetical protein
VLGYGGQEIEQMNLHRRLAALFVILALVGCAQVATGQVRIQGSGAIIRSAVAGAGH